MILMIISTAWIFVYASASLTGFADFATRPASLVCYDIISSTLPAISRTHSQFIGRR